MFARSLLVPTLALSFLGFALSPMNTSVALAEEKLPPSLEKIQSLRYSEKVSLYGADQEADDFKPLDIRRDALREAALSLGARAGLATRTYEIREQLKTQESYLDKVFNFRRLLIKAPSGLLIEPPIVAESLDALNIEGDAQTAAVADRIIRINKNARIVSAPRNWRTYLEREWGDVDYPPAILYPKDDEEIEEWNRLTYEGWLFGIQQANEIFQTDLHRLLADFEGMIRYRNLLVQGVITAPFALEVDRGVTGDQNQVRVGDRAVQITGPSELRTDALEWQPGDR